MVHTSSFKRPLLGALLLSLTVGAWAAAPKATDVYSRDQLSQSLAPCANLFPSNAPTSFKQFPVERQLTGICSNSFAVLHSSQTKTPALVVERLSRAKLLDAKGEERTNDFYADPRLKASQRANLDDYARSGFDRGHLAPAADQPDAISMQQSFALSNMVPQDPTNNRKVWSKLEADTRKYALRAAGDVFVFSGPLFSGNSVSTIGKSKVWVPTHLFKLVYDATTGKAWAHVLHNDSKAQIGAPMSYAAFVALTGLQLLPASANR